MSEVASGTRDGSGGAPRICVMTRMWRRNGTGLFAQELATGLLAVGAKVAFICPRTTSERFEMPQAGLERLRPPRERDGGPRWRRIAASLARIGGGALALARARARYRTFVFTLPDPLAFAAIEIALLRLTGARIIFIAHDVLPHAWKYPRWFLPFERATYAACYRAANAVVVLSKPTQTHMRTAFPALRTPVHVIEHGPLVVGLPVPAPGARRLLCFGTLRRNKGIIEAIEGVEAANRAGTPTTLIVAGDAHAEDPTYYQECAAVAGRAGHLVDFRPGYVDDDKVANLLAECDALLMPYGDFHSQSGVALLAAANARAIIASDAGGLAPLLEEGFPAIRIERPCTAAAVARAVAEFYAVPIETWRERAEAYRQRTLEQRSWVGCAEAYLELAREIAR